MSHLWLTSFCGVWETRASFKRWDSKVLWCEVGVAGCARSVCRGVPEGSALCMQRAMRDGVGGGLCLFSSLSWRPRKGQRRKRTATLLDSTG